jgi:hypothetical protein
MLKKSVDVPQILPAITALSPTSRVTFRHTKSSVVIVKDDHVEKEPVAPTMTAWWSKNSPTLPCGIVCSPVRRSCTTNGPSIDGDVVVVVAIDIEDVVPLDGGSRLPLESSPHSTPLKAVVATATPVSTIANIVHTNRIRRPRLVYPT